MPLSGRVALITGASRGLGRGIALALAPERVRLALAGRDREKLAETCAETRGLGAEAEIFTADVSDEGQVRQLERDVIARFGQVNVLINNAGINIRKTCLETTLDEWNSVLHTNLTSVFLLCRSFIPHMKGHGWGRIVNIASMMGHVSIPQRTAYSSSKAGVIAFTRALAIELAGDGIGVVSVSPGLFATDMTEPILNDPAKLAPLLAGTLTGRPGRPDEVGKLVAYLCSEDSSFITGSDILIDGGWTAQ
ncbi:MAG TPA: SDR family NAD(P)-dependent oxidoreductase [Bryobacteraceae bacterium]|nr:SDR family NAD(P)-dependent oxidoreductase [Bryobacteraceae bacterium]